MSSGHYCASSLISDTTQMGSITSWRGLFSRLQLFVTLAQLALMHPGPILK